MTPVLQLAEKIRKTHIEHHHFQSLYRQVHAHVHLMPPGNVLVLVGPTRVGKSELLGRVINDIYGTTASDGTRVPCARVEATKTSRGTMSSRYLTLQILKAVQHPMHGPVESAFNRATESMMRDRVPMALNARGTEVLLIDEAHHLLETQNSRAQDAILEGVKCLGNETGVKIVLGGGYKLLNSCFESAHLNGRQTIVEFPRYRPSNSDVRHFERILVTFDELLPWKSGLSLYQLRQLVYDGTFGCCGLLSGWIIAALGKMVALGERRLTAEHFLSSRFAQQLVEIRRDIEFGEGRLTPLSIDEEVVKPGIVSEPATRPSPRLHRPGHRKPVRDPVGGDQQP